jgi:RecB family exonuclease
MLADLRLFAADRRWPRIGLTSEMEKEFEFELAPGLAVAGKIDRLDTTPAGEAYVIDYKYSNGARTRDRREDPTLLQAPLYLLAAEKQFGFRPAGFFYVGVKGEIGYYGWSSSGILESIPVPENWFEATAARAIEIVGQIRAGTVAPAPADRDKCRWCDARDICRIDTRQVIAMGEGA